MDGGDNGKPSDYRSFILGNDKDERSLYSPVKEKGNGKPSHHKPNNGNDKNGKHPYGPDKAVPIITNCIVIAITSILILEIAPFLKISDTAIGMQKTILFWIFALSSITAIVSICIAIYITCTNWKAIKPLENNQYANEDYKREKKSLDNYRFYFALLALALLLLLSLEVVLIRYNYIPYTNETNLGNSYSIIDSFNPGMFNDSLENNILIDRLDQQPVKDAIQYFKLNVGYVKFWDSLEWRFRINELGGIQKSAQLSMKSQSGYPHLGNYSIITSNYTPIWNNEITNPEINARISRLDFTLSGQDKESLIVVEFKSLSWASAIHQNTSEEDLLHLYALLIALTELVSNENISETADSVIIGNPDPRILMSDTKTGIKGYARVISPNDVVILISNADYQTFGDLLRNLRVLSTT